MAHRYAVVRAHMERETLGARTVLQLLSADYPCVVLSTAALPSGAINSCLFWCSPDGEIEGMEYDSFGNVDRWSEPIAEWNHTPGRTIPEAIQYHRDWVATLEGRGSDEYAHAIWSALVLAMVEHPRPKGTTMDRIRMPPPAAERDDPYDRDGPSWEGFEG